MQNIVIMEAEQRFNIRVYGIIMDENDRLLLSTESRKGMRFTKFPGGGLDWGEGLVDCLRRELIEELGLEFEIKELFYLTEHFQRSAFRDEDQLISVYYKVELPKTHQIDDGMESKDPEELDNHFYWYDLKDFDVDTLTFPIDREVIKLLVKD